MNLSEKGLAIRAQDLYGIGTILRVAVKPLDLPAFDLEGVVVWSNAPADGPGAVPGFMGVRLTSSDARYTGFVQRVQETSARRAASTSYPSIPSPLPSYVPPSPPPTPARVATPPPTPPPPPQATPAPGLAPASWDAFISTGMPANAPNLTASVSVNITHTPPPALVTPATWPPGAAHITNGAAPSPARSLRMPRFDELLPVHWGQTGLTNRGFTENLSRSGLALTVHDPIPPGSRILMGITLPEGQVAKASGIAVWQRLSSDGSTSVGVRLLHADDRYLKLIDLLARQR